MTVYVVDSEHKVRRSCGNCGRAEWNGARTAFRCPRNVRGTTLWRDEPCPLWRLEDEAGVWDSERKEWLRGGI